MDDNTRQAATQVAREFLARRHEAEGLFATAESIRAGRLDRAKFMAQAIAVALAAADAVRAITVRECAEVAETERTLLRESAANLREHAEADATGCMDGMIGDRERQAATAFEIADSILALIGEDSASQSPLGQAARALEGLRDDVVQALALVEQERPHPDCCPVCGGDCGPTDPHRDMEEQPR